MISLHWVYLLAGTYFLWLGVRGLRDAGNPRRVTTAAFWFVLALLMVAGERLPALLSGSLVLVLAVLAGCGGLRRGRYAEASVAEKAQEAQRLGHRLFLPALMIPIITVLIVVPFKELQIAGWRVFASEQTALIALTVACLLATLAACRITRDTLPSAIEQARRLADTIGWAALLPLLLATLGAVFDASGVGVAVASVVEQVVPADSRIALVLAYALGMAAFTVITGNAFAAFPVMTAGIALPLLVGRHGAEPAALASIGMLSGYCGTLLTPMAANFNLVPAALLELRDPNAVIRAQIGTALPLLACNIVLMYLLAFR